MATGLTRGQIRAEVRAYLMNVDLNQAGWTDAELNLYADEGAFYIQQLTSSLWDYAVIPVVANQADYTLPDNQYQLIRSCFDRQFLPQTTEYELDRDTSSAWRGDPTGTPCRFYLKQFNAASLYQKPRTSGNFYVGTRNYGPAIPWFASEQGAFAINGSSVYGKLAAPGDAQGEVASALNYFPGADQFAECTITSLNLTGSGNALGPAVRMTIDPATGLISCYVLEVRGDGQLQMVWETNCPPGQFFGSGTDALIRNELASQTGGFALGSVLRIEAVGNQITGKINGSMVLGPIMDNRIATGQPGLEAYPFNSTFLNAFQISNFNAGPLPPGVVQSPSFAGIGDLLFANGEVQSFTLPNNVTIDSSLHFSSELGCVTQLINTSGSSVNRFEPDQQNRFVNPDYGIVTAFADETQNLSFMFVAQTDSMFADSQSPQFQETFHPAMVYYTLMRCFAREGEFQDLELANAWYQVFLDWMDAALQASAKEFPTMVKSAEPYGIGNILSARLQAVGPPSQMIVIGTP